MIRTSYSKVRFEEISPAHMAVLSLNITISHLVAHLDLPIFDSYDDLDDLLLAFVTLPSRETVVLTEYSEQLTTSVYIETVENIPQTIADSCKHLQVSYSEIDWIHPDWSAKLENLNISHNKVVKQRMLSHTDKQYEPIECFNYALQIYTRSKSPENWAQLQHNLGLAYFNRVKGDTRENLIKSIECYYRSLEVYTQELFPRKWQINQEDLEVSQDALSKLA